MKTDILLPTRDAHISSGDIEKALLSKTPRGFAVDADSVQFSIRRPYNSDPLGTWCVLVVEGRADAQKEKGE